MKTTQAHTILAIITTDKEKVGGGIPIFYANSFEELERKALYLARILMAAIHSMGDGTYIIVKH
ncbi:MAG: hypothetical protein GX020_09495 [Firmicutes bacterium]|nr:hypothetical protein [Bacillota bacterium]